MLNQAYWKRLADKQQQQNKQRIIDEQRHQETIKQAYMHQLSQQLRINEERKKFQKDYQKMHQKSLINQSIESHRKDIEREEARNRLLGQQEDFISQEGKKLERAKQQQTNMMNQMESRIEKETQEAALAAERHREEDELRRKRELGQQLIETIEGNREQTKREREYQIRTERNTLNQGDKIMMMQEMQRAQFYHNLRQKAKIMDYGSHQYVEQTQNKRLLDKKRQQWRKQRQSIQLQQRTREMQQRTRSAKMTIQNQYREELKSQMQQNQRFKRQQRMQQLQNERRSIEHAEMVSNHRLKEKMGEQEYVKKDLARVLKQQAEKNYEIRQYERGMNHVQEGMNKYFMDGRKDERRSIDTFELDHHRKKQYATIQKSLNISKVDGYQPPGRQQQRYFARRGASVLQ